MRIIDSIPHPQLRISIFSMNDKYQVKIEAGPYEQTYKFEKDDVEGLEDLKARVDDAFLEKVAAIFREMHAGNVWRI
ncbi:MAG: hypothetical protein RLZZ543_2306 [Bacteroidota bacterium]|jgi:hypothetical protein